MAERTKLESYIIFSALNTLVFCFPAHWVWAPNGWLKLMGMIDVAGDGPVHLVGGVTGLIATLMLKPRHGRYDRKVRPAMGSPTNALLGMFMLWWGWLGFNCGSTFGISGMKWKLAARSAVATLCSSVGGGMVGLLFSYIFNRRKFDVGYLINSILGSLVAITGLCALAQPWEGLLIGAIGAMLTLFAIEMLNKLKIDDPVGCVGVHAVGGAWGLLAAGLFARPDNMRSSLQLRTTEVGLIWSGQLRLLGIQTMSVVAISAWTAGVSYIFLKVIDLTVGLRMSLQQEILGADLVEHAFGEVEYDKVKQQIVGVQRDSLGVPSVNRESLTGPVPEFNEARKSRRRNIFRSGVKRAQYINSLAGLRQGALNGDSLGMRSVPETEEGFQFNLPHWGFDVKDIPSRDGGERKHWNGEGSASSALGKYFNRRNKSSSLCEKEKTVAENAPRVKRRSTIALHEWCHLGSHYGHSLQLPQMHHLQAPPVSDNDAFMNRRETVEVAQVGQSMGNGITVLITEPDSLPSKGDMDNRVEKISVHM